MKPRAVFALSPGRTAQATISQLQSELTALTSANQDLQSKLDAAGSQVAALQLQLTAADSQITTLEQQNGQLTAKNQKLLNETAAITRDLQTLTQLLASMFNSPGFQLPGSTPDAQVQNLVTAISQLNHGQKQALFRNLGGTK